MTPPHIDDSVLEDVYTDNEKDHIWCHGLGVRFAGPRSAYCPDLMNRL